MSIQYTMLAPISTIKENTFAKFSAHFPSSIRQRSHTSLLCPIKPKKSIVASFGF